MSEATENFLRPYKPPAELEWKRKIAAAIFWVAEQGDRIYKYGGRLGQAAVNLAVGGDFPMWRTERKDALGEIERTMYTQEHAARREAVMQAVVAMALLGRVLPPDSDILET